jgi:hypothetical protein
LVPPEKELDALHQGDEAEEEANEATEGVTEGVNKGAEPCAGEERGETHGGGIAHLTEVGRIVLDTEVSETTSLKMDGREAL